MLRDGLFLPRRACPGSDGHLPRRRPHVGDDAVRNLEGILDLLEIWLENFAWIPEPPRILRERSRCPEQGLERRLVLQTRKS